MRALKKVLHKTGTLDFALSVKRRFIPAEESFRPCTPNLLIAISEALKQLKADGPHQGDYLEFGLYRGFSLWYAQQMAKVFEVEMRYFGFDSFTGLPKGDVVKDAGDEFPEGAYECTRNKVEAYFNQYGIDWKKTVLVEGFYDKTLKPELYKQKNMTTCRLAVIDCDLYTSTRDALGFLLPLIQEGTIILFDDWNSYEASNTQGERAAFGEFLRAHTQWKAEPFTTFGNHGAGFTFRKK